MVRSDVCGDGAQRWCAAIMRTTVRGRACATIRGVARRMNTCRGMRDDVHNGEHSRCDGFVLLPQHLFWKAVASVFGTALGTELGRRLELVKAVALGARRHLHLQAHPKTPTRIRALAQRHAPAEARRTHRGTHQQTRRCMRMQELPARTHGGGRLHSQSAPLAACEFLPLSSKKRFLDSGGRSAASPRMNCIARKATSRYAGITGGTGVPRVPACSGPGAHPQNAPRHQMGGLGVRSGREYEGANAGYRLGATERNYWPPKPTRSRGTSSL